MRYIILTVFHWQKKNKVECILASLNELGTHRVTNNDLQRTQERERIVTMSTAMLLCCCAQRTLVVLCPEPVMWHPSALQPPCPSSRLKSQCAAMGSTPTEKCRRATVTGCTGLHPSAHESNTLRQTKSWSLTEHQYEIRVPWCTENAKRACVKSDGQCQCRPDILFFMQRLIAFLCTVNKRTCENATQLLQHHARNATLVVHLWRRYNIPSKRIYSFQPVNTCLCISDP